LSTSCKITFKYGQRPEDSVSCVKTMDGTSDYLVAFAKTLVDLRLPPQYFGQFTQVLDQDAPNDEMTRLLNQRGYPLRPVSLSQEIAYGGTKKPNEETTEKKPVLYKDVLNDAFRNPGIYLSDNPPPVMITTKYPEQYSLLCDYTKGTSPEFVFSHNLAHEEFQHEPPSFCISGDCLSMFPDSKIESLSGLLDSITSAYLTTARFSKWRNGLDLLPGTIPDMVKKKEEFNYTTIRDNFEILKGVLNTTIASQEQFAAIQKNVNTLDKLPAEANMYFTLLQCGIAKKAPFMFDLFSHMSQEDIIDNEKKAPFVNSMYRLLMERLATKLPEEIVIRGNLSYPSLYINFIKNAPLPSSSQITDPTNSIMARFLDNYAHIKLIEAYLKKKILFGLKHSNKILDLTRDTSTLEKFFARSENGLNDAEHRAIVLYKDNLKSIIITLYTDFRREASMLLLSGKTPPENFELISSAFSGITRNTESKDNIKLPTWFPAKALNQDGDRVLVTLKTELSYRDLKNMHDNGIKPNAELYFTPYDAVKSQPLVMGGIRRDVVMSLLFSHNSHDGFSVKNSDFERFVLTYKDEWESLSHLLNMPIVPNPKNQKENDIIRDSFFLATKNMTPLELTKKTPLDLSSVLSAKTLLQHAADIGAIEFFKIIHTHCPPKHLPVNFDILQEQAKNSHIFAEIIHQNIRTTEDLDR